MKAAIPVAPLVTLSREATPFVHKQNYLQLKIKLNTMTTGFCSLVLAFRADLVSQPSDRQAVLPHKATTASFVLKCTAVRTAAWEPDYLTYDCMNSL